MTSSRLLLVLPLGAALVLPSHAADATWSLNADGSWADDGNWNPASAPGATTGTSSPDTATFGTAITAARTITVDPDRNLSGINFAGNSSAYILTGGSLLLTSGGTIQTSGGGSGHTDILSTPVTIANAEGGESGTLALASGSTTAGRLLGVTGSIAGSATSGSSTLVLTGTNPGNNTVSGNISNGAGGGTLAVEKSGPGTWILTGTNPFSGGLTIKEGELRLANPGGVNAGGTATCTLGDTSGSASALLRVDNSFLPTIPLVVAAGSSGTKTLTAGNVANPGYNGAITLNSPLTVAVTTSSSTVSTTFTLGGTAPVSLDSHTLTLRLAQSPTTASPNNNSAINISKPVTGSGAIVVQAAGSSTGTRTVTLSGTNSYTGGTTVGGAGNTRPLVVQVNGNQSAATGGWSIDTDSDASGFSNTVNFNTGSTVAVASGKSITLGGVSGHFSARTLNAAGTVTVDGTLLVRRSSTVNVTGSWTQNGTATIATQGGGQAALTVPTGGTFTYAASSALLLNTSTSNDSLTHLSIPGGTFITGTAIHNATGSLSPLDSAYSQVTLDNGGTLRLSADVPSLLTRNVGNIRLALGGTGSGGIIDTDGFHSEITAPVVDAPSHAGMLTKSGGGTLTLSGPASYSGSTTVAAGSLVMKAATLSDVAGVTVADGAKLVLDFTGTDTVASIQLGTLPPLSPGTYTATTHPGFLEGPGSLTIPNADPYPAWIDGFFTGITDPAIVGRSADPDLDGVPNLVEYLTGGNPSVSGDRGHIWVGTAGNALVMSLAIRGETTAFSGSPSPSAAVDGATATVTGSTDLSTFASPVSAIGFVLPADWPATPPAGFSYHSFTLDASSGLSGKGFLRLGAE